MTINAINDLRAERAELLDLLDDVNRALEMNPEHGPAQSEKARLLHIGFGHETVGRSMRFRAARGLFDANPAN